MGGVPLNLTSREKDIFGIVCVTEVDVNRMREKICFLA